MKRLRDYSTPSMRLKACYKILAGVHDFERPRKISKLHSRRNNGIPNIILCLKDVELLTLELTDQFKSIKEVSDARDNFTDNLSNIIDAIDISIKASVPLELGKLAPVLSSHTRLRNTVPVYLMTNSCKKQWMKTGLSSIMTWEW